MTFKTLLHRAAWFAALSLTGLAPAHSHAVESSARERAGSAERPPIVVQPPPIIVRPPRPPIVVQPRPPFELPRKVDKVRIGVRANIYPAIHKVKLAQDNAVIHPMINMYQADQRFADLFADNGSSQICGAAAMANAMVYLKFNHGPRFPNILQHSTNSASTNGDYVRVMFDLCETDRNNGTLVSDMRDCAAEGLQQGNYSTANTFIKGIHSDLSNQRRAPTTTDLRSMSASSWTPGAHVSTSDRAVVLLFGWYSVNYNAASQTWDYTRNGGHYVTLAGYSRSNSNVFYVSNPLVDYNAMGGSSRESRISFEAVPNQANVRTPGGFQNLIQTRDLVGGNLAVLEDMVITLPWN